MKKQTIIVTGASSPIGTEIARYFLKNGDNVVLNSFTSEKLTQTFLELGGGDNLAMVAGDVSNRITGIRLLAAAVGKFGSADVLVNNAGIFEPRPFFNVDEAYLNRFLDTNIKGAFFTTQGIIPQMLKQGGGVVINIGTPLVSHQPGGAQTTPLLAPKGAIHALTIQLAAEFGKHNIRFTTVVPGVVRRLAHSSNNVDWSEELNSVGEAKDIAQMVHTVAKSNFISGTIITT